MPNNKLILLISIISIVSIVKSLNIDATTNNINADYQKQLNAITKTYESQWDVLTKNADKITAKISAAEQKNQLLDKLLQRIKDKNDPLDYLQKYEPIIYDSTTAHLIYDNAYDNLWNNDNDRSAKLFKFLINEQNPNGFSVGNSHYWLARYYYIFKKDITNALNHYLMVHKFPACLVFTDNSYYSAGEIYNKFGKKDIALALYSVQIPHIDFWEQEVGKAGQCLKIAIEQNDITNIVYQILRAKIAVKRCKKKVKDMTWQWEREIEELGLAQNYKSIEKYVKNNYDPVKQEINCTYIALEGVDNGKENPLLEDMLLHDWPMIDEVDDVILNNRDLSNNIFPQKRRKNYYQ